LLNLQGNDFTFILSLLVITIRPIGFKYSFYILQYVAFLAS